MPQLTVDQLRSTLEALEAFRGDPRVRKDMDVIDQHLLRMEASSVTAERTLNNSVRREARYTIRAAQRVVEQRAINAARKVGIAVDREVGNLRNARP